MDKKLLSFRHNRRQTTCFFSYPLPMRLPPLHRTSASVSVSATVCCHRITTVCRVLGMMMVVRCLAEFWCNSSCNWAQTFNYNAITPANSVVALAWQWQWWWWRCRLLCTTCDTNPVYLVARLARSRWEFYGNLMQFISFLLLNQTWASHCTQCVSRE